jgi:SAM-dependent methyltransferase
MTQVSGRSARFFDAIAGRYDRVYGLPAAETRRRLSPVFAELPTRPARVLDLGVGTGRELSVLQDAGHNLTGLDASAAMLERCARRARPVRMVQWDFWQHPLPFDARSFEAAIALHGTLAHPPDDGAIARLARELARVVAAEGVFVAEVPSLAWLDSLDDSLTEVAAGAPSVRRTGPRTCTIQDLVVGASIEARLLDQGQWLAALAPEWRARVEPLGELEWLVVARRK